MSQCTTLVLDLGEMLSYTSKSHFILSSIGRKNGALTSLEHFALIIHLRCHGSCDTARLLTGGVI